MKTTRPRAQRCRPSIPSRLRALRVPKAWQEVAGHPREELLVFRRKGPSPIAGPGGAHEHDVASLLLLLEAGLALALPHPVRAVRVDGLLDPCSRDRLAEELHLCGHVPHGLFQELFVL